MELKGVIFDLDGTLVETERHGHRVAFNRAFARAGLSDYWNAELYGHLLRVAGGRERLRYYLEELRQARPEDPESLAAELHSLKVEEFAALIEHGLPIRPGVARLLAELNEKGLSCAVATTGNRDTTLALLQTLGANHAQSFAAVLSAGEAPEKKPHPQVYEMTLATLGLEPEGALAVEDSRNGLLAAKAASMPCVVTVSDYSAAEDFAEADLVLRSLGEPEAPARVLHDPHGMTEDEAATVDTRLLERVHRSWLEAKSSP